MRIVVIAIFFIFLAAETKAQTPPTVYFDDPFTGTTSPTITFGGSPNIAYLTASGSGEVTDAAGSGYLRLTRAEGTKIGGGAAQTGYAYSTTIFPSTSGVDVEFEYYTYGRTGEGADGITFFLFDADALGSFNIGGFGGSLGYAQRTAGGPTEPGVSGGYLGIGIDEFGNFSNPTEDRNGGVVGPDFGGASKSSVTLRGDESNQYPWLTTVTTTDPIQMQAAGYNETFEIAGDVDGRLMSAGQDDREKDPGYRKVRMKLTPRFGGPGYDISVRITVGDPAGAKIYNLINYYYDKVAPDDLSFGFAASTGYHYNVHEIRNIDIEEPVNEAPVVTVPANILVIENTPKVGLTGISFADIDAGMAPVTVTLSLPATSGTLSATSTADVTVGGTGTAMTLTGTVANINAFIATDVTYMPETDSGTDVTLTVRINDGGNTGLDPGTLGYLEDTETVTLLIDAPPVAVNDAYKLDDATSLTVAAAEGVLANDTDDDHIPPTGFTATKLSDPAVGTLTLNADGSFGYVYDGSVVSHVTFTYKISDPLGVESNIATVIVNLVNAAPAGTNNTITLVEDDSHTFAATDFGFTDSSPADALKSVIITTIPTTGSLILGDDAVTALDEIPVAEIPDLVYTPAADASGTGYSSFTFQVVDDGGTLNGGVDTDASANTIIFDVTAVNDAPVAVADAFTVAEGGTASTLTGGAASVLSNDTDAENDPLTATVVTDVANGTLILDTDGTFNYVHDGGETTSDSFTYKINDGTVDGNTVTVSITITAVNDAPVGVADAFTVAEGGTATTLTGGATSVLTNDTDAENDPLTATVVTDVANGTLTLDTDGTFSYVHDGGETTSDSFTYKINDGTADGNTITVSIIITTTNVTPVALADSYSVLKGSTLTVSSPGVLDNDTDADGNTLTAIKVSEPSNGTLTFNANGSFSYAHDGGASTSDSFTYKVNDGTIDGNTVTVSITITATNDAPVAAADSYSVLKGSTLTISSPGVLENDTDADGNTLTAIKVSDPSNGTLTFNANGSFSYAHNGGASTSDSFTYKVNDGMVDGNTVTVNITITATNAVPVAIADSYSMLRGGTLTISAPGVLANDIDLDNNSLSAIKVSSPLHGNLAFESNGSFIYVHNGGPEASDNFTYRVSDGTTTGNLVTVNIIITSANAAPVTVSDQYNVIRGETLTVASPGILSNDTDAEGNSLTAVKVSDPVDGTLRLNANGSFIYVHNGGVSASDSFTYRSNDGTSDGNITTVTVTIEDENTPPAVSELAVTGTGFQPISFSAGDFEEVYSDADGDPLSEIRVLSLPAEGVLKLDGVAVIAGQEIPVAALGGLTYESPVNWSGTTTFSWNGSDGSTYADEPATVSVTIALAGDPAAKIGLAKHLASLTPASNGTYNVKFVFTVKNFGPNGLESISVRDNLALAFGGTQVSVTSINATGNLEANTSFNGLSVTEMLQSTSTLSPGEQATIEIDLNIKLGLAGGTFVNSAVAEAVSAVNGIQVTDVSTNGLKPDPLAANDVSPSEATPVQLDAMPSYVPQGFSPNGDGQNDKFVIQNAEGKHVSLEVFNRWGNRVYRSADYQNDWGGEVTEGFFIGREIPDGTYYYIIIIDRKDKYAGFITINR